MNESVYYNVDEISGAVSADKMIRYKYFEYALSTERRFRKDGAFYEVSPFALMWDDENYYMLAWDSAASMLKHYRVDKMTEISAMDKPREGKAEFEAVDMSSYSKKVFGMFTGETQTVKLKFKNNLAGAVIDRFGKEAVLIAADAEHFTVNVNAAISPLFYAWLFSFGTQVEVLSPECVRAEMRETAAGVAALHENK